MPTLRLVLVMLVALLAAGCAEEAAPPAEPAPAASDTRSFDIPAGGSIEYKLRISKDGQLAYSWSADRALVYDFHGDTGSSGYQSHKKGTAVTDQGDWTAPFSGNHGWYWKNAHREPVRVTLTTSGDYTVVGLV